MMGELKLAEGDAWRESPHRAVAGWWRRLSLKGYLLLMVLSPIPLWIAALGAWSVFDGQRNQQVVMERGRAIAGLIAPAAGHSVATGQLPALESLLRAAVGSNGVVAAAIYDRSGGLLAASGSISAAATPGIRSVDSARWLDQRDGRTLFAAPVLPDGLPHGGVRSREAIGWIVVELKDEQQAPAADPLAWLAVLLALAALAVTVASAARLAHSVGRPVEQMADALRRMSAGEPGIHVGEVAASRELHCLQEGVAAVARLADTVESTLQARIDEATGQLAYQARHDALTGLPNRRAFELALDEAVSAMRRAADQGALCFIDLDRFKAVNDECGHAAGDAVLRDVARLIQRRVRAQDLICRIGGDEFALVLRDCTAEDARRIADGLCEAVAAHSFEWECRSFRLSASVGLARIDAAANTTDEVFKAADIACYAAKRNGRNQVVEHHSGAAR